MSPEGADVIVLFDLVRYKPYTLSYPCNYVSYTHTKTPVIYILLLLHCALCDVPVSTATLCNARGVDVCDTLFIKQTTPVLSCFCCHLSNTSRSWPIEGPTHTTGDWCIPLLLCLVGLVMTFYVTWQRCRVSPDCELTRVLYIRVGAADVSLAMSCLIWCVVALVVQPEACALTSDRALDNVLNTTPKD
jgi:hypothetical protein